MSGVGLRTGRGEGIRLALKGGDGGRNVQEVRDAVGDGRVQVTAGDRLFEQSQYAQAASAFEGLPDAQKSEAVLNRLAICYHRLNRIRDAERTYRRAIKMASNFAAAYNNLGALYYSQRRFADSEGQFRRAAERDPQSNVVRRNLHASRYARENVRIVRVVANDLAKTEPLFIQEISNDYLAVLVLLPATVKEAILNHTSRGDVFMARKMFDDAAIEYRKSLALDRYDTYVINRLGIAYLQSKKLYEAEQQYRETLRLDPFFPEALNNLGFIEYTKGNFDAALDRYAEALRIQPRSATVFMNIAACYFSTKEYEEGAKAVQQALEIDPKLLQRSGSNGTLVQGNQPNDPMMYFHLAKVVAVRGDKDQAMVFLYKAADLGFKGVTVLKTEPAFLALAADERFSRLLETMTGPGFKP